MVKKKVDLSVRFLRSFGKRDLADFEWISYNKAAYASAVAGRKARIAKINCSRFYVELYAGIFRGHSKPFGRADLNFSGESNGSFRPDVMKKDKYGHHATEVKTTSVKRSQPLCGREQAAHFFLYLNEKIKIGEERPSFDYAFFSYGDYHNSDLGKENREGLLRKLSGNTNSLVVVPSNLALFLFLTSSIRDYNHKSSEAGNRVPCPKYFTPKKTVLNLLADNAEGVDKMVRRSRSHLRYELSLDKLKMERFESPTVVVNGKYSMEPFMITKYSFHPKDEEVWLKHFYKNYSSILEGAKIPDLTKEAVPF